MKSIVVSFFLIAIISCKEVSKEVKTEAEIPEMASKIDNSEYPETLIKVFDAHGGLTNWKNKRTLSYVIQKPVSEQHTIDLRNRNEKIEMPEISMGSVGNDIWLLDEKNAYKGDAVFYHNLMFYFYAMPFVLSDNGINYDEAESLEFEGTSYPGIRISYNDGIGLSSKDEYFIHYNPKTFQMEWLGYTVTFRSGEKSDNVKWIRYNDWMDVSGVKLPKALTWYDYEGRTIKNARDPLYFKGVTLTETAKPDSFFARPQEAKIVNATME